MNALVFEKRRNAGIRLYRVILNAAAGSVQYGYGVWVGSLLYAAVHTSEAQKLILYLVPS